MAAGYGTRFLPITKSVPKELLPIGNRPAIDFVVDEFVAAGITDVLIVISPHKRLIAQYYRPLPHLERFLRRRPESTALLQRIAPPQARIRFALQRRMLGTGHALLQARRFVGADPVIVAYPDDLHIGTPTLSQQLMGVWRERGASVLAAVEIASGHERYGMLDVDAKRRLVRGIIEKPAAHEAPSNYASIGRFLLQPRFFDYIAEGWRKFDARTHPEYYHVHALSRLIEQERLTYHLVQGTHVDIGNPAGYLRAIAMLQPAPPSA